MEEATIGTKSTRADILQTIYDRRYAKNENIEMTDLGFEVLETLGEYCPSIISVGLTRELERKIEKIRNNGETRKTVLDDAVNILKRALEQLGKNEKNIGIKLGHAISKGKLEERIVGLCPVCKTGKLIILRSRKTGKQFIGCSNYFKEKCRTSFSLPQSSPVNAKKERCKHCGWPVVQVQPKGKPAWVLCFNPDCTTRTRRENVGLRNM